MKKNYSNYQERVKAKKNKELNLIISLFSLVVLIGIGFAFFSASVSNANKERFSTETASISLEFDDNDNGISGTLNLGESITKKFTLENTGTKDAYAKINWYNLVNTYTSDSLTWTLEQSTSENGTYEALGSGKVPTSNTQTTKQLKNGILVPVNTTYYYKLTITLNNLDVNQNSDINASFYSYFNLEEGSLSGADTIQNLVAGEQANTTDVITKPAPGGATCTNTLAYDGTVDNNLRYVGANPCNYVTFNGESPSTVTVYRIMSKAGGYDDWGEAFSTLETCNSTYSSEYSRDTDNEFECQLRNEVVGGWRIIGVMNNVDDGTGNLETRIKLVRNDSLGNYSWDTSKTGENGATGNYGVNDWTQADLMQELNGDYLNTSLTANTMWYNGRGNQKTAEYDYTKGLSQAAQAQIGNAKWYLGGMTTDDLIPNTMYSLERGTKVWGSTSGQTCNDGACPRATEWTGKVALIYPSDYGYATAGGEVTNRNSCINTLALVTNSTEETWNYSANSNCKDNDWLNTYQRTLSPDSGTSWIAFFVTNDGFVHDASTVNNYPARPAVYLGSGVTISEGDGTQENPYVFSD